MSPLLTPITIAVPPNAERAVTRWSSACSTWYCRPRSRVVTTSDPGTARRCVAAGDRSELAVMLLLLHAIDAAQDVVVLLLEPSGPLQIGVGAADDAAGDVALGKDP